MKKFITCLALAFVSAISTATAQTVTYDAITISDDGVYSLSGLGNADTTGYGANKAPVQATLTGPDTATYYVKIKGAVKNLTWDVCIDETGSGTLAGTVVISKVTNYIGNRSNWASLSFLSYKSIHSDTIVDGDQVFDYADTTNPGQMYKVQIINSASTTICKAMVLVTVRQ